MSCSPFDLKDYFLGELRPSECAAVENHVVTCQACREELQALQLTRSALLSLPDEEPPHRIAFVSDKVFEPSWWHRLWHSGPQLGFASAAMLSLAILVHTYAAPRSAPPPAPAVATTIDTARVEQAVRAELDKRLDGAVREVIAESEDRRAAKLLDVVNARIRRSDAENREILLRVSEYLERVEKRQTAIRRASFDGGLQ